MATTDEFDELLERQRKVYLEARSLLSDKLGEGIDNELIGYSKYAGVTEALAEFYNDPGSFGYAGDLEVRDLEEIKPILDRAYKAEHAMMRLINDRESALCAADPDHVRRRIHLGREYVMDRNNKQMRFLDTEETYEQDRSNSRSM